MIIGKPAKYNSTQPGSLFLIQIAQECQNNETKNKYLTFNANPVANVFFGQNEPVFQCPLLTPLSTFKTCTSNLTKIR